MDLKKYVALVRDLPPSEEFLDILKYFNHPFFNKIQSVLKTERNLYVYLTDY